MLTVKVKHFIGEQMSRLRKTISKMQRIGFGAVQRFFQAFPIRGFKRCKGYSYALLRSPSLVLAPLQSPGRTITIRNLPIAVSICHCVLLVCLPVKAVLFAVFVPAVQASRAFRQFPLSVLIGFFQAFPIRGFKRCKRMHIL